MHVHAFPLSRSRRGSALIMVLGILAVLILMAVAFSSFVRMERSGSTNLKNGIVARSSLNTAVCRVMDAIDMSFDSPALDYPVAVWPNPWLASDGSITNDYFQSARLGDGESAGAHVLTADIAEYLTPSQLALARAAKCNWAPILGSVSATSPRGGRDGGIQGFYGRPRGDDLLGRYAFIVIDTTGLADINMTGGGDAEDRADNVSGGDTLSLVLPKANAEDSAGTVVKPYVKAPATLVSKRAYSSFGQARKKVPSAFDETLPTAKDQYYPADLLAGFAPSLEPLDPEGNPKIFLPPPDTFNGYSAGEVKNMLGRTFNAMAGVFGRSRASARHSIDDSDERDVIRMFQSSSAEYKLRRSALATIALMDGLDKDFAPGFCNTPTVKYWEAPPDNGSNVVNGTSVVDPKPPTATTLDPCNFPCTESAPLVDTAYAFVEWDDDYTSDRWKDENIPDAYTDEVEYHGKLYVGVRGHYMNRTFESSTHSSRADMTWEALEGEPKKVSGSDGSEIRDEWLELPASRNEFYIDWDDFFTKAHGTKSESFSWNDNTTGSRGFSVEDEISFTVKSGVKGDERDPDSWEFYPPTALQADQDDGHDKGDLYIPIRIKVTVKDTVTGKFQQQVPAPALEAAGDKEWWIRVNPCVFHGNASSYGGDNKNPGVGWAFCAAPAFACDTTSLLGHGLNNHNFWISDQVARPEIDPDDPRAGAGDCECPEIADVFWTDANAHDNAIAAIDNEEGGRNGDVGNWLQFRWLVRDADQKLVPHVSDWLDKSTGHVPDMLHAARRGTKPFVASGNGNQVDENHLDREFYTYFPVQGYSSLGQLGSVMCGPLETLSVFKTFRTSSSGTDGKPDFHPVVDYFTTSEDRYPTRDDYKRHTDTSTGRVDWDALSGEGTSGNPYKDVFSAAHNGRVNLNAPPLVKCTKVKRVSGGNVGIRGIGSDRRNPYPIATVLNGAPYPKLDGNRFVTNQLSEADALLLATDLCRALEDADDDEMWGSSSRFSTNSVVEKAFVRDLSFLGVGQEQDNPFLRDFIAIAEPECDYDRESLLSGIVDGFSTRGQTYLAIIRADAYSPKFGENASVEDGTTLATTHAIVELFRDPAPARSPDGSLPKGPADSEGRPVIYHNWYIRSFRVF